MIHWPAIGTRGIGAEPVDLAHADPEGNAPRLWSVEPEPGSARAPMRGRRRAGWTALALVASTAVHAAALVLLADKVTRNGVEAANAPMQVEIVLEGPAAIARPPIAGAEAPSPRNAVRTVAPVETAERETAPAESATLTPSKTAPETAASEPLAAQTAKPTETVEVNPTARQPVTVETRAADAAEVEPVEEAAAVALPMESIPLPTPRPEPPAPRTTASAKAAKAPARSTESAPGHHAKAAPIAKQKASPQTRVAARSQPAQAGRTGGATAGEKAAYARRLMRHVERYKRYPNAAERQGIAGASDLSITIDRAGGLAGARLARGSGHALLDEEAIAVARRAAPYPRPPEGIGGSTVSFTVTLRFSR